MPNISVILRWILLLLLIKWSWSDVVQKLFIDWKSSLLNEGKVILTNEHYAISLDCASTLAGQRILSSRIFENVKITWLVDNYFPLYSGADGRKVIYDVGNYRSSQLRIIDVTHGDSGLYTCNLDKGRQMVNRFRTISYFIVLTKNPPIFHIYLYNRFNISCPMDILYHMLLFADADLTKWSVRWLLNNQTVREGQIVNSSNLQYTVIDPVEQSHQGIWQCQMEHIGNFKDGQRRRIYLLKRFILNIHDVPSFIIRMPAFEILRIITPLLGFLLTLMVCSHFILAVVLFEKFAKIETKFQVWQVVNKFSKKNYMKFYLHQLRKAHEELLKKAEESDKEVIE